MNYIERFLDFAIAPVALIYLLFVAVFVVTAILLIAKVRRDRGLWGDHL